MPAGGPTLFESRDPDNVRSANQHGWMQAHDRLQPFVVGGDPSLAHCSSFVTHTQGVRCLTFLWPRYGVHPGTYTASDKHLVALALCYFSNTYPTWAMAVAGAGSARHPARPRQPNRSRHDPLSTADGGCICLTLRLEADSGSLVGPASVRDSFIQTRQDNHPNECCVGGCEAH